MRAQVLSNVNLIRKTGPQFKSKYSISSTGYVTYTIPATAQVGDYLILITNNVTTITTPSIPSSNGWLSFYSTRSSGSTYVDNTSVHIKICRAGDAGSSIILYATGFHFEGTFYVFSNPNNFLVRDTASEAYSALISFIFYSSNSRTSASTTSVSSINIPDGAKYGANYTRLSCGTVNPNSATGYITWSGSGTLTQVNDGYYWRGLGSVYEQQSLNLSGNFISSQAGGMAWQSFYII